MQGERIMRFAIALGLLVGLAGLGWAGEKKLVGLSDVPTSARQAADKTVPGVHWLLAVRDSKGWYKIVGRNAGQFLVEFNADPDGRNSYFRIEVPLDHVPAAVTAALQQQMPGFRPDKVQSCGMKDGIVLAYRYQGSGLPAGKNAAYVSSDGGKVFSAND
jgi:hypothetical protein